MMDESTEEKKNGLHIPHALYQKADLNIDLAEERIHGSTTLWLAFSEDIEENVQFALHSRVPVNNVLINGKPAPYDQRDALGSLAYSAEQRTSYSADKIDTNFRCALEIGVEGELRITVPSAAMSQQLKSLQVLPDNAPADIRRIFSRLDELCLALGTPRANGGENGGILPSELLMQLDVGDDGPDSDVARGYRSLLQVQIFYDINCPEGAGKVNKAPPGIVFRRNADAEAAREQNHTRRGTGVESEACCAYSLGAAVGGALRDPDGVRCWLPCLDIVDQRCIFDITFTVPSTSCVVCSGRRVSVTPVRSSLSASVRPGTVPSHAKKGGFSSKAASVSSLALQQQAGPILHATRFVTASRLPAAAVGFFIGRCETYRMNLYRTHGRVWVATGIADTMGRTKQTTEYSAEAHPAQEEEPISSSVVTGMPPILRVPSLQRTSSIPFGRVRSGSTSSVGSDGDANHEDAGDGTPSKRARRGSSHYGTTPPRGRSRSGSIDGTINTTTPSNASSVLPVGSDMRRPRSASLGNDSAEKAINPPVRAFNVPIGRVHMPKMSDTDPRPSDDGAQPLYETQVRHTTLGLDLAVRLLHKFCGHLYTNNVYTQVFIHGLGETSLSWDGFSLLDAKFLHGREQIFSEMPAHMAQLQAYVYSWLLGALPLDSSDLEFLIHGLAGLLLQVYVEQVFGSEEAICRLRKLTDTVLEMDKAGKGGALTQQYPLPYSRLGAEWRVYVRAKSTVLFTLLESRMGGRDCMRLAIQSLVQSSSLYENVERKGEKTDNLLARVNSSDPSNEASVEPPLMRSASLKEGVDPPLMRSTSLKESSHVKAVVALDYSGNSLFRYGSAPGLSFKSFFVTLASCASNPFDNSDLFVRQYIHNAGSLLLNISSTLDTNEDNTPRNFSLSVHAIAAREKDGRPALYPSEFVVRVYESRDDTATDQVFALQGRRENLSHQLPRRKSTAKKNIDPKEDTRTEEQKKVAEEQYQILDFNMTAIDLARKEDHPVRMVLPDPSRRGIWEASLLLPAPLLVELLFSSIDDTDPARHILALRNLRNCVSDADKGHRNPSLRKGDNVRMVLKAFTSCISGTDGHHCPAVSAEAAYCLAAWQTLRSPRTAPVVKLPELMDLAFMDTGRTNAFGALIHATPLQEWIGLGAIVKIIRDQYMIVVADDHDSKSTAPLSVDVSQPIVAKRYVPAPLDLANETATFLQGSILLALSTIRSQSGATPRDAIDLVLQFAAHSLRLGEEDKFATADGSHYRALLLLCLAQIRTETGSGDAHGDLGAIAAHAVSCLNQDWAAARTHARIKRSLAYGTNSEHSISSNSRVALPTFENGGIITAAALTALVEGDLQVFYGRCRRLGRDRGGQADYSLHPFPSPFATLVRINYLNYFLPPGVELVDVLVVPGAMDRTEGRLYAMCTSTVRTTACEAFVRSCFAQHIAYGESFKLVEAALLRKNEIAEQQALGHMTDQPARAVVTNNNLILSETAFLPVAILAVLAVLKHDNNRNTRRQACATLRSVAMDLPPRQLVQALSCDEPMRCFSWADPQGVSAAPVLRFQSQHRQALQNMNGDLAKHATQLLWTYIVEGNEDQCVRSELLQLWLYMFSQENSLEMIPRVLADECTVLPEEDPLEDAANLITQRLVSPNPLDTYTRAQYHLGLSTQGALPSGGKQAHVDHSRVHDAGHDHEKRRDHRHRNKSKRSHRDNNQSQQAHQHNQTQQRQQQKVQRSSVQVMHHSIDQVITTTSSNN